MWGSWSSSAGSARVNSGQQNNGTIPWSLRRNIILVCGALGLVIALVTAVLHWTSESGTPAPPRLLIYSTLVALSGFLVLLEAGPGRSRWTVYTPWAVYGALLAAIAVGPLFLAPWLLSATAAFALAAVLAGLGGLRGLLIRTGTAFVAGLASFAFLWLPLTAGGRQIPESEFRSLDLQAHSVLTDIPLHDAWVVHLPGGGDGRSLQDVREIALGHAPADVSTIVAGLIGIRMAIGGALNLDSRSYSIPASSYSHLLAATGSMLPPAMGEAQRGLFRPVYMLENEALIEMSNRTGLAYIAAALRPAEQGGYRLYWGIYVKETSWLTPLYMALIDPFRRHVIYPAALSDIARTWRSRYAERG